MGAWAKAMQQGTQGRDTDMRVIKELKSRELGQSHRCDSHLRNECLRKWMCSVQGHISSAKFEGTLSLSFSIYCMTVFTCTAEVTQSPRSIKSLNVVEKHGGLKRQEQNLGKKCPKTCISHCSLFADRCESIGGRTYMFDLSLWISSVFWKTTKALK